MQNRQHKHEEKHKIGKIWVKMVPKWYPGGSLSSQKHEKKASKSTQERPGALVSGTTGAFWAKIAPREAPRASQKGPKIDKKLCSEAVFFRPCLSRCVLSIFGRFWVPPDLQKLCFRLGRVAIFEKSGFSLSEGSRERFWVILGICWAHLGGQKW